MIIGKPFTQYYNKQNGQMVQFLVEDILRDTGYSLLSGETSIGKSMLGLHMACAIASTSKHTWLGKKIKHGKVLWIDLESDRYDFNDRMHSILRDYPEDEHDSIIENIIYDDESNFQIKEHYTDLADSIDQHNIVLVVIDVLSRACAGIEENSNSEMALVTNMLDRIGKEHHCCILALHHTTKDGSKNHRGAYTIETAAHVALVLKKNGLSATKNKYGEMFDWKLYVQASKKENLYKISHLPNVKQTDLAVSLADVLEQHSQPVRLSAVIDGLKQTVKSVPTKETVRKVLETRTDIFQAIPQGTRKATLYTLSPTTT